MNLYVKEFAFIFFLWSLQSTSPLISRSQVQCQATADTPDSCLPIPPYRQTITQIQEVSVNYEGGVGGKQNL